MYVSLMNTSFLIVPFAFILGASWGSFLYTFFIRYTNGTYNANPLYALTHPSHCVHCGVPIKIPYIIPVIGYVMTQCRCSSCSKRISPWYPLSELGCGIFAVIIVYTFPLATAPVIFAAATASLCIAAIDIITMEIPHLLAGIIMVSGIILAIIEGQWLMRLLAFGIMFAVFTLPLLIKPESFGGGDSKFAAAIGFFLSFPTTIVALEIALITGAVFGIAYALLVTKTLKSRIPFAPFLTAGFIISLFAGDDIMLLYYRVIGYTAY